MIEVEFDYNQNVAVIQAKLDVPFQDIINKYLQKSLLDSNSVYFLANGRQINPEQTVESQMNELNKKNKKMKVLVQVIEGGNTYIQVISQSKNVVCPKCKEPCRINLDEYHLKLFECINKHSTDIKIKDFPETQKINKI